MALGDELADLDRDAAPAPLDPVADAVVDAVGEMLFGATATVEHHPHGLPPTVPPVALADPHVSTASATGGGPEGWDMTVTVQVGEKKARLLVPGGPNQVAHLVEVLPGAAVRAAEQLRPIGRTVSPALRRAVRDALASEVLAAYLRERLASPVASQLVADTIEYLIELGGTRVEAHDLTHGVVVTDVLRDEPRLELRYPDDLRAAKRAPLLFDGRRSVLVVDPLGRARTELQRHRLERLGTGDGPRPVRAGLVERDMLVSEATRLLGGVGFYVRADRSIWTFVDGQPLLVRRGEHWTAFPVQLEASIAAMIGGGRAATLVARTAFLVSTQPHGAILAIVDHPGQLDEVVSAKDRFDLRHDIDVAAVRPETRLHHLLDIDELDEQTLARLATLDGATILDRDGNLLAYGAIVASADSQYEGARTAAARTLSETASVVLKVSVDGDITVFRRGAVVATLLGNPARLVRP